MMSPPKNKPVAIIGMGAAGDIAAQSIGIVMLAALDKYTETLGFA